MLFVLNFNFNVTFWNLIGSQCPRCHLENKKGILGNLVNCHNNMSSCENYMFFFFFYPSLHVNYMIICRLTNRKCQNLLLIENYCKIKGEIFLFILFIFYFEKETSFI